MKKKYYRLKNPVTEIKCFDRLINRLDTAKQRISELQDMSIESSRKKAKRKIIEYPRTVGQL